MSKWLSKTGQCSWQNQFQLKVQEKKKNHKEKTLLINIQLWVKSSSAPALLLRSGFSHDMLQGQTEPRFPFSMQNDEALSSLCKYCKAWINTALLPAAL